MRELKFQVYKVIAGWLLIIASVNIFCSSQKYIFYVAKKKCSDIGNIGNKSTDIVILGPISGFDNSRTYVPEVRQHHGVVLLCFQLSTT